MKKRKDMIKLFGITTLFVVIGFSVLGCSASNPFLGKWSSSDGSGTWNITFDKDGRGMHGTNERFTYTYEGNVATIITYDHPTYTATISSDDKNRMTIISPNYMGRVDFTFNFTKLTR